MDKKEYQDKLNEISKLVALEDYAGASGVADSIDWKRVRNVQTLVMVSEIYEAVERYEDSKALLLRAYRRSPLGRTVLFRLVECTIKLGQFDEAIEYYSEYVQAAPHDNNKYILKYKIYRGRGSSVEEQIAILREYLDQEYNEKWAYELAKLQISAGMVQDAISTCDDLVLWFHSGKYVVRALELKRKYAPLTPKQQEIYDSRLDMQDPAEDDQDDRSYLEQAASFARTGQAASLGKTGQAAMQQEVIKSELAHDILRASQNRGEQEQAPAGIPEEAGAPDGTGVSDADAEAAAQSETPGVPDEMRVSDTDAEAAAQSEMPGVPDETVASGTDAEAAAQSETPGAPDETVVSDTDAEAAAQSETPGVPDETVAPDTDAGAFEQGGMPDEADSDAQAPVYPSAAEPEISEKDLQEEVVKSMREIVQGVGPREEDDEQEAKLDEIIEQSKADQEAEVAARGADLTFSVPQSAASEKRTEAQKLTIDDILLSMGEKGRKVREAAAKADGVLTASEEARLNGQAHGTDAFAQDNEVQDNEGQEEVLRRGAEEASAVSGEASAVDGEEEQAVKTAPVTSELPCSEIAEQADAFETAPDRAAAEDESPALQEETADDIMSAGTGDTGSDAGRRDGEEMEQKAGLSRKSPDTKGELEEELANLPPVEHVEYTKEIAEAKTKKLPVEEIRRLHDLFCKNGMQEGQIRVEKVERPLNTDTGDGRVSADMGQASAGEDSMAGRDSGEKAGSISDTENAQKLPEENVQSAAGRQADMSAGTAAGQDARQAAEAQARHPEQRVREVKPQEEAEINGPQIYGGRPVLKEYQKDLFRGFLGIGSLEEQITNAIAQAEGKKGDRTSRTGNILILGGHGCGKTTIATGIAKAIAEDQGTHSVKMARIYAADLNRKDIAATIAKIAGGVLIIEEAGDLEDAIVDQLTTAMEFRTDGLIIILEDEQRYVHDLLMRHPRFTMKFTAQIYIPAYTNEDLVNFCQLYAESKDYVFSEGASAALYDRIGAASQGGEMVSISNVIELVDRAMKKANKFFRRIGSAKKRFDSMDRVILREKDFR